MERYKRYTPYTRSCTCNRVEVTAPMQSESKGENCICDKQRIPLAMAYVKDQQFKDVYGACEGLSKGTIFAELYKPYCTGGYRR